mgnify:CR=1 FL=1
MVFTPKLWSKKSSFNSLFLVTHIQHTRNPQEKCWDYALTSPARARKDRTTSARLDARAPAEGASSSSSSSSSFYVSSFSCVGCLEFFYPKDGDDVSPCLLSARERQNVTDRLLLSSHACDKTG